MPESIGRFKELVNKCCLCFSEGDPNNYMTYYRRATVYLAMGKSKSALPDLDKVIELKPDFTAVSIVIMKYT